MAWTSPSFPTSQARRTSPARRTGPEVVPAGADNTPLSGEFDLAFRVFVALVIGLALGTEREISGHAAGMRTMALIGAGSCLFTGLGLIPIFGKTVDPTRIAAQIVTGVGFLGAGSILRQGEDVRGLTTAAMIWVVASLGMAVGFGYYTVAVIAGLMVIVTLVSIKPLEERFIKNRRNRRLTDPHPPEPP
ncbi:MAG: MgtC/SapB family protein [Chloroflexi bacterium]|nr:MAG: MgtC/SapB family protein [Chloroflexota bacterium]